MGTPERSERAVMLRQSVHDALARARDRHDGRLSRFLATIEPQAIREGLTKDDFYRAARLEQIDQLSLSKLSRLQDLLERAGYVEGVHDEGSELQRAILALSRITRAPEKFRRALPCSLFCLRNSYLVPGQINVSYVEITAEDLTLRYRETRAGSLGAASQRSVLTGTLLHHDDLDDVYYVIGLNEFRTSFAVEEATNVHANLVSLSILRQCHPDRFDAFVGIHLGVMPDNNPLFPAAPFASRVLLIETIRTLADASRCGLIQNHPAPDILAAPDWLPAERQLVKRYLSAGGLSNAPDGNYDLLVASTATPSRATPRRGRARPTTR